MINFNVNFWVELFEPWYVIEVGELDVFLSFYCDEYFN